GRVRALEAPPLPRSDLLPVAGRRPPGSPGAFRARGKHLPGPPDPRVRDSEGRRGPPLPERLRPPLGEHPAAPGPAPHARVSVAGRQPGVRPGRVPGAHAPAGDRVECSFAFRRGLLLPEGFDPLIRRGVAASRRRAQESEPRSGRTIVPSPAIRFGGHCPGTTASPDMSSRVVYPTSSLRNR